jgi:hypothetical protein
MKSYTKGFTRLELLFITLAVGFIGLPAISLLATSKTESQRVVCFNNLRQIGRGFLMWANDHGDRFPFSIDFQGGAYPQAAGTLQHPLGANRWFQFDWVSNQIGSPKILSCPANQASPAIAETWNYEPGGLWYPGFQNNAVSYFIGLHAQPYSGQSLLSGDRNIKPTAYNASCSLMSGGVAQLLAPGDTNVVWTNAVHGTAGHLLFSDGSVHFANSVDLQRAARDGADDNNTSCHLLNY